jgi:16S rRNA (guanine966-N2)-methyltransferase
MSRSASKTTARSNASFPGKVRIIGGRWRSRRIDVPPLAALRPSPDRVRETVFNWLQSEISGARCLDLFAGSGALGIEALSRGASHVVFVDCEPTVGRHLNDALRQLEAGTMANVHIEDASRFLEGPVQAFDVVFLDPPFSSDLLGRVLGRLANGWLRAGGHVYVESPADAGLPELPPGWTVHRSGRAGQVGYHLLRSQPTSL